MIKYLLIPVFLFQIIQLSAQKSDWTDADRKRFKKVCEEKVAKVASDDMAGESQKMKDAFVPLFNQVLPVICPCLEQEVVKKYPERKHLFTFTDDQLANLIAKQDGAIVETCFENVAKDSTIKIGWTKEIKTAFISMVEASINEGAKGQLPEENCKNIATCFVDKMVAHYPNPIYPMLAIANSKEDTEQSNEIMQLVFSCIGATPAEKK